MSLSRRRLLGAAALGLAAGCAPRPGAVAPPPRPLDGPDGLLDWITTHPDRASVLVDDGHGGGIGHLADHPRPIASAAKVIHLVAYAQAVTSGRLDPDAPVPVAEWERWYVPGTDGGAHPAAVQALGLQPADSVRWDDLMAVMVGFSDNAAPDLLRETLGDAALVDAAAAGGWTDPDLPSFGGESLLALRLSTPDPPPTGPARRAAALAALRAYAADPAQRAAVADQAAALAAPGQATPPGADAEIARLLAWFDGAPAGTAAQLAGMHRAAATGGLGPQVSAIVRGHLERPLADRLPAGVRGAGQKGGNLPGLICNAVTIRREDGSLGLAVVSLSGMSWQAYQEALASGAPVVLSQQVLLDQALLGRLRTAVGQG